MKNKLAIFVLYKNISRCHSGYEIDQRRSKALWYGINKATTKYSVIE